jgi:hypothetical protein
LHVAGGKHGILALFAQIGGQFGGKRRFARALQTAQQDHRRGLGRERERRSLGRVAAEQFDHLLVDDLDDLLGGFRPAKMSPPTAFSVTRATKSLTTRKLTSASKSAKRTSRMASATSSSRSVPDRRSR